MPGASAAAAQPGIVLAGFRLVEQLGSDGLGELYRAQNVHAPKLLRTLRVIRPELAAQPDFRVRLLQLVELLDTLNHPNLLHTHHVGEEGELLFTVHELLVGRTLRSLTADEPLLRPVSVVADWIFQALCGLGHAHRHGIIHQGWFGPQSPSRNVISYRVLESIWNDFGRPLIRRLSCDGEQQRPESFGRQGA